MRLSPAVQKPGQIDPILKLSCARRFLRKRPTTWPRTFNGIRMFKFTLLAGQLLTLRSP
jgi:hypothetical protein